MKKSIMLLMQYIGTKGFIKKAMASTLAFSILTMSFFPFYQPTQADNKTIQMAEEQKGSKKIAGVQEATTSFKDLSWKHRPERKSRVSRGNLNRDEVILLAMVIEGEAADEPYNGKVAVGAVILNRMESDKFPNTLSGVVYQDRAFESVMNGQFKRPLTTESIKAAQAALQGWDPTNGALYF
ncbi:N-acetylmuramoyl-L-alanine amidase [Desulforamulus putei DSM 12395]|uniref:N-acetylmuramoyl-L-alanine amidase n=1 Tax=Desulforamulus putei DSM 12395 TaxID=1121429 RepID=A0A1M4VZ07_9FIRM|nr:N-acetylmuramoyl-L-alanine amidase [Desulforamulus putei DSM 12395]